MPSWSVPYAIPHQSSYAPVGMGIVDGELHMMHVGHSSDHLWHSIYRNGAWTPNVDTGLFGFGTPALADGGFLVYRESGFQRLVLAKYAQGKWAWVEYIYGRASDQVPGMVRTGPSEWEVVLQDRSYDWMLGGTYRGPGSYMCGRMIEKQSTEKRPQLALLDRVVHMVHLAGKLETNDVIHSKQTNGVWRDPQQIPGVRSVGTPGFAAFGGRLHLVYRDLLSNSLYHATFDGRTWSAPANLAMRVDDAPTLAAMPDALHVVFSRDDNQLWHATYR